MNELGRLFLVSRPVSWINTAFPFTATYIVTGGAFTPTLIIGSLFFLIPYNLLMYGVNDVYDYESDILNPRKGGIEGMREERALHPLILKVSLILPIPFVLYLLTTGSLFSHIVLVALLFFVVAYSLPGLRFKEVPILDSVTSSIHFVGPLIYALTLTQFSPAVWAFLAAFFLWGMASHAFGAVQDIIPDRAGNLSSIATVFGARVTTYICLVLYLAAACLVFLQGGPAVFVGIAGMLYALNIAPYIFLTDLTSPKSNRAWRRFIWLNAVGGFAVTVALILTYA